MVDEFSFSEDDQDISLDDDFEEEHVSSDVRSVLAHDLEMEGELHLRNGLEVNGHFKGIMRSNSKVRVMKDGKIEGDIDAFHVIVEGNAKAKMTARKRLEILKGGLFTGTLESQPEVIVLSEFATFGANKKVAEEFAAEFTRDRSKNLKGEEKPAVD